MGVLVLLRDLVAVAEPALAIVECEDIGAKGSGFFVSGVGHLVTNNHVVAEPKTEGGVLVFQYSQRISVIVAGKRYPAVVVSSTDAPQPSVYDYAILRVEGISNGPHLRTGDRSLVQPGDQVVCLGFPLDFESLIATAGIVSAVVRRPSHVNSLHQMRTIVTDALVQFGNSGGPMVHVESGAVVGINTLGHELRDALSQRLASWSSHPSAADFPVIRDLVDFTLKYTYVGLNHAISVEHVKADPAWPGEREQAS